jgi:hypothetical protein
MNTHPDSHIFIATTYDDDDHHITIGTFRKWEDAMKCAFGRLMDVVPDTVPLDRHELCNLLGITRHQPLEYARVHCHPGVEAVFKGIDIQRYELQ